MASFGRAEKGWGLRIYEARVAMKGRRGSKMSQAELGEAVGVSPSQIGFYEAEANEPGRDAWEAMASALGVTPGWLAFGQEPRYPSVGDAPRTTLIARDIIAPRGSSQIKGKGKRAG